MCIIRIKKKKRNNKYIMYGNIYREKNTITTIVCASIVFAHT